MEQINTYTNNNSSGGTHQNSVALNSDAEKLQLKDMVADYMNFNDVNKRIRNLVNQNNSKNTRFNVNIDELREFNPRLASYVQQDPLSAIKMFQDQLNQNARNLKEEGSSSKVSNEKLAAAQENFPKKTTYYSINFEGNFGKRHITPRGLRAELMNQYVQVSGIVTKMSIVKPIIHQSVHYCEETKRGHVYNYDDQHDLNHLARKLEDDESNLAEINNGFKTTDNNGNPLSAEYGYCLYKDQQTVVIQEMPERTPPGQLPRSIEIILEDDLVDKCKPGDRITVTGIFRAKLNEGRQHAITKNFIIATGLQQMNFEKEKPNLTENDIKNIRKISKDEKLFDILGNSIGSTIEGLSNVKKGLLLQLLGGAEKNLETGTHLRGDINILMVGDPSTAKSQLLRHIMDIAPLAINTTGRGSTGVGLTAAVTCDKDTGEKHLEAGAMVLADRGIVCIDEFDKMNDVDKVAIHEVMEQQTVTIAKAGIHVSLNARCSVIAAANPIYSEYSRDLPVGKNIAMPDSLLSRFDLLFVVLDEKDADHDRKIAERVIANHRYQAPHQINDMASVFNYTNEDVVVEHDFNNDKRAMNSKEDSVFEKSLSTSSNQVQTVTRDFLKKYISYAKAQKQPELAADSIEQAAQFYSMIRTKALNYDQTRVSVPITVRTLETMIRLSTAHAKLRLSKQVEPKDVEIAVQLLNESIFQEVKEEIEEEEFEEENVLEEAVVDQDGDAQMMDDDEVDAMKKNASNNRSERYAKRNGNNNQQISPAKENHQPNIRSTRQQHTEAAVNKKQVLQQQSPSEHFDGSRPSKRQKIDEGDSGLKVKNLFNAKNTTTVPQTTQVTRSKVLTTTTTTTAQQQPTVVKQEPVVPITTTTPSAQIANSTVPAATVEQKRYLYKLMSDSKGGEDQISVDKLWKSFMIAPETEVYKKGKPLIQSKQHMMNIVKELENDNLVMYSHEDGQIVLI